MFLVLLGIIMYQQVSAQYACNEKNTLEIQFIYP